MFPLIKNYVIHREIGNGGMATVYEAEDTRLLRRVAIKVLHPHLCKEQESAERFIREARAAAKIDHPNVVRIFDFAVTEELYYIVMEYVPGTTADRLLVDAPDHLSRHATPIMVEIAHALMQAHNLGIIHRDIKPANILLHEQGRAMLSDFGLAHHLPDVRLTSNDAIAGTPLFMSPEQISGKPLTAATDIYSWGVCWYTLLSGKLPYATIAFPDVLTCIRKADLVFNQEICAKLPPLCHEVLRRCCCVNPADRIADAKQLVDQLRCVDQQVRWSLPASFSTGSAPSQNKTAATSPSATLILATKNKGRQQIVVIIATILFIAGIVTYLSTGSGRSDVDALMQPDASSQLHDISRSMPPHASPDTAIKPGIIPASLTDSSKRMPDSVVTRKLSPKSTVKRLQHDSMVVPDSGRLFIACTPWAEVAIDSLQVGTTPFAQPFRLAAGRHVITLNTPFCKTLFDTVAIIADTTIRKRYTLPTRHE